jgi:sugar phosphate isomerase/epimerase
MILISLQPPRSLVMKLGVVTYMIAAQWDVPTIIKNLRDTRFDGVELRTTHAHQVEVNLSADQRREVRKQFEDGGIEIAGLGSAFEFHALDPAALRKNIEGTKEYIKLAHDLGCPGVKVRPNGAPQGRALEDTLRQIGDALREVGDFGRGYGVHVRVEVHGAVTAELPNIRRIMDFAAHENVYVCWNSNDTDLDQPASDGLPPSIEKNFRLVADKIVAVHMRDLFLETYPWRELFRLLHEVGYEGYCLAEIPASTDPIRLLRYYRSLWLAYQPQMGA